jgi:1,4-alpha-glucan branching enzyme
MATIPVQFLFIIGLKRNIFRNVRLEGTWDYNGRKIYNGSTCWPMTSMIGDDGCPCFGAKIDFDESQVGVQFTWSIVVDGPSGSGVGAIPTEGNNPYIDHDRWRTFLLGQRGVTPQEVRYYLTHCRRLGANKYYDGGKPNPGLRFAVWAPNAEKVEVVFGGQNGYIADDGFGINQSIASVPMFRQVDGVWQTDETLSPVLANFSMFDHKPYMYRITKNGGKIAYRTDLYSRCQIGSGKYDPLGSHFSGKPTELDGTKSCSVVINPDTVAKNFKETVWPEHEFIPEEEFWQNEFSQSLALPSRVEDLVIYELHVGGLGYGKGKAGNIEDAINLLDYIQDIGVNAIELLPTSEFEGWAEWGYGTSHYFAIEYSSGGRDQFKHFVRECHRRGLAVILDVVYNHYHHFAERAEWAYDSDSPEENIYYWYEGKSSDYPGANPPGHGGYIDNMSTGYAPRFYEEMVRKMFISSAVALMEEFHVDGFRVDQTTSMHLYNVLHANGMQMGHVNLFGAKFLRELTRTLKLINPKVILIAEDHSDWNKVTEAPDAWLEYSMEWTDGLGFDATWYANFYHHLIGDTGRGSDFAKLLQTAGYGEDQPLAMDYFAGVLAWSGHNKIVYHESHDEAGNSLYSKRTIVTAVNSAPLIGKTRSVAEDRCRFCFGMAILSAGTPLFFMGEEIGAQKSYKFDTFLKNREDLKSERKGEGRRLFKFYQDLIRFRLGHSGLRSHNIEVIHVHNNNRVIAFLRWDEGEKLFVIGSLNNNPFNSGYWINNPRLNGGFWREVFNSDSQLYGGENIGNYGSTLQPIEGAINVIIPANGFVVLQAMRQE